MFLSIGQVLFSSVPYYLKANSATEFFVASSVQFALLAVVGGDKHQRPIEQQNLFKLTAQPSFWSWFSFNVAVVDIVVVVVVVETTEQSREGYGPLIWHLISLQSAMCLQHISIFCASVWVLCLFLCFCGIWVILCVCVHWTSTDRNNAAYAFTIAIAYLQAAAGYKLQLVI